MKLCGRYLKQNYGKTAVWTLLCIIALVLIDQVTKSIAVAYLGEISSIVVIDGILDFTLVRNFGAAWGMLSGARWFFVTVTIIVLGYVVYVFPKLPKTKAGAWAKVGVTLLSAGAVGNLFDRLLNEGGYVVDFFRVRFIDFPVFNMADIYVVSGAFLLSFLMLFFLNDDRHEKKEEVL
jgi:signal peptidase II